MEISQARSLDSDPLVRIAPYIVTSVALGLLAFSLWPPTMNGTIDWARWRWISPVAPRVSPEMRLLLLVAAAGGSAGSLRVGLQLLARAAQRSIRLSWVQGMLQVGAGVTAACLVWLVVRSALLGQSVDVTTVNVGGVVALTVFAGFFGQDALVKVQEVFTRSLTPQDLLGSEAPRDDGQKDSARRATALASLPRLKRLFERSEDDIEIGRTLAIALRDAGQAEEGARVFERLIDAHPDNVELLTEQARFYRDIGDESRYVSALGVAEDARAKQMFDDNAGKPITLAEVECRDLPFFGNFTWTLQPGVNVLLGRNGYGKSHLLRAIVSMLLNESKVSAQFLPERAVTPASPMLRVDVQKEGTRLSAKRSRHSIAHEYGGVPVLAIPDMRYIEKSEASFAPLATVPDLRRQGAEQFVQEKPFNGVILTFLYELSKQFARNRNFKSPIFALIQGCVRQLTDGAFTFHDVEELDNAHLRMLVLTEGNASVPLPIQKASQGTLSVLSMIGLTYRFLNAVHRGVSEDQIRHQQAIVFIDEIDAHLHPAWQQRILQLFRETFPNVQFIVTAHTPLVVAGCKRGEVAVLDKSPGGFLVKVRPEPHFIGASAVTLYQTIFDVDDTDLTYLKLSTRQGERAGLERRRGDLKKRMPLSPSDQEQLEDVDQQLYYLDQVDQLNIKRERTANLHRERQRLEMDLKSLKGENDALRSRLEGERATGDLKP